MIPRRLRARLIDMLGANPAVVLLGPRQIGKTTLAIDVAKVLDGVYRDLENPRDVDQVSDIGLFEEQYPDRLIVLDEVQRTPEIFAPLRGIVDRRRRDGMRAGQFLFLGSASLELMRQSSESLAGRIAYAELSAIDVLEYAKPKTRAADTDRLWIRGGYPDALTAKTAQSSMDWRLNLIRTYLERDIPQFGFRVPSETMRRFWTMLAHRQGGLHNAAALAEGLGLTGQTVARYADILVDLLLVRRLEPWHANLGKRLVKSPKLYVRDSGLLHALLSIPDMETLLAHPVVGASWEGFAVENLLSAAGDTWQPHFYRTQAGAEIDLVLVRSGKPEIAIEFKRASVPQPAKGFHIACDDLGIERRYVVYPGSEAYPAPAGHRVMPLPQLMEALSSGGAPSLAR